MVPTDDPCGVKPVLSIRKDKVKYAHVRLVSGHGGDTGGSRRRNSEHVMALRHQGRPQCITENLLIVTED